MECYTYLRNVTDLLSDGKTPYERRFGQPFNGPIIPFGSLVEYHPITAKDQSRIHQFGKKVLPGIFLGYALYAGGIWKGDVLVADIEELETMDASEICSKRINAKAKMYDRTVKPVVCCDTSHEHRHYHRFVESTQSASHSEWDADKAWSSQEWKSDELMDDRTVKPVVCPQRGAHAFQSRFSREHKHFILEEEENHDRKGDTRCLPSTRSKATAIRH